MLETINIQSTVPVYQQIENSIRYAVASGKLQGGDRITPVKELASKLGVNFNTVAKSYRDLEVMGLIFTRRGMGCFIRENVTEKCAKEVRAQVVQALHEVTQSAKLAGIGKGELADIISASFALNSTPYGETPASIMALAKARDHAPKPKPKPKPKTKTKTKTKAQKRLRR